MAAHANKKAEIGVVRAADADIQVQPTITDVGVPTDTLIVADNLPGDPTHKRQDVEPVARQAADRGIGIPFNPNTGTIST